MYHKINPEAAMKLSGKAFCVIISLKNNYLFLARRLLYGVVRNRLPALGNCKNEPWTIV
jgi:hypothetical protein